MILYLVSWRWRLSPAAMKLLGWNCSNMAMPWATHAILDLQRQSNPDVMFLSKSHLGKVKAGKLMRKLKFDEMLIHESGGRRIAK